MTSDYWTEMADFDAELQRLLNGGLPSTEAPAWFGDVAVLVRTAHAPARPDELAGEADIVARMVEVRLAVLAGTEVDADDGSGGVAPTVNGINGHAHRNGTGRGVAGESDSGSDDLGHSGTSLSADGESGGDERTRNGTSVSAYATADDQLAHNRTSLSADGESGSHESRHNDGSRSNDESRNGTSSGTYATADDDSRNGSDERTRNGTSIGAYPAADDDSRSNERTRNGTSFGTYAAADDENGSDDGSRNGVSIGTYAGTDDSDSGSNDTSRNGVSVGAYAEADGEGGSEPLEDRLRERIAVSDLDEYRAKHGGERYYVAKHAAPAPDEPPHAVARTVGRVIAMKAVAVTTAAIIGVAAAAAATTGIVATVVVPAINDHYRRPVPTSELQDEQKDERDEPGTSRSPRNRSSGIVTPPVSATDPLTGAPVPSPSTTLPAPTSSSVPADTTTSTTDSTTTTTSEPPPPPDTTPTSVGGDLHPFSS